jgi:hypothetical protein
MRGAVGYLRGCLLGSAAAGACPPHAHPPVNVACHCHAVPCRHLIAAFEYVVKNTMFHLGPEWSL